MATLLTRRQAALSALSYFVLGAGCSKTSPTTGSTLSAAQKIAIDDAGTILLVVGYTLTGTPLTVLGVSARLIGGTLKLIVRIANAQDQMYQKSLTADELKILQSHKNIKVNVRQENDQRQMLPGTQESPTVPVSQELFSGLVELER